MDDSQAAKVIRFPGKHKETESTVEPNNDAKNAATVTLPVGAANVRLQIRAGVSVGLLAIALATVAVNRYAYRGGEMKTDSGSRAVASVHEHLERDAAWEKSLAERLSQPGAVSAAAQLGRKATRGEELRFGTLEDRYVIDWTPGRTIRNIKLGQAEPVALDGLRLVTQYGSLFDQNFAAARPKSGEGAGATETYELLNADGQVLSRATFAYDAERRLISVENTPVQI